MDQRGHVGVDVRGVRSCRVRPGVVSCVVELRGAATDLLHPVVREGLATLRGALSAVGRSLPRHVLKELEGFLGCGEPVNGFAWLHCAGCDHRRLVCFAAPSGWTTMYHFTVGGPVDDDRLRTLDPYEELAERLSRASP